MTPFPSAPESPSAVSIPWHVSGGKFWGNKGNDRVNLAHNALINGGPGIDSARDCGGNTITKVENRLPC